jgi:hypothetical protein
MIGRDSEFAELQDVWLTGGHMLVVRGDRRIERRIADWPRLVLQPQGQPKDHG